MRANSARSEGEFELIGAHASEAEKNYEVIVRQHAARVLRLARHFGFTSHEAEDVSQDVFLRVWRGLPGFRGDAKIGTWIFRIAVRECSRRVSRRRKPSLRLVDVPEPVEDGESALDSAVRQERLELMRNTLEKLPGKHRDVLVLRYLEGMTREEVASTLNCNLGTVNSRLHYARKKLKRLMKGM